MKQGEFGMVRWMAGVSGALFCAALLAADAVPAAPHVGWLPTLGRLALGGLLGSMFGASGFGAAFILTLLAVVAVVALRVFGKSPREAAAAPRAPGGSDTAQVLRSAKLSFVKLQAARDLGRLDQAREFTTAEMYETLQADRGAARSDVVELHAALLEIGGAADRQVASVRFSGMARAKPGAVPVGFAEVWNLARPAGGASGWLLAGIQQMR